MIRSDWLLVLLTVLAVARLTRLVTTDVVFQPFRAFVIRHRPAPEKPTNNIPGDIPPQDENPKEDWLVYLVHCPWCSSIWISFPVAAVVYNWPCSWPVQIGLLALAASLVAGLSGRWE